MLKIWEMPELSCHCRHNLLPLCTCLVIQHLNMWLHFILALYSLYRMVTEWGMSFLFQLHWSAHGPDCIHASCSDNSNELNKKKENTQQHPHILKQFHSLQWDHICRSLFTPSSSEGAWGHLHSPMYWTTLLLKLTHRSLDRWKASPFLVAFVFRDVGNLISQITSHFIFSDHSSHWLFQLQVLTYVNMNNFWATMKWGRWS